MKVKKKKKKTETFYILGLLELIIKIWRFDLIKNLANFGSFFLTKNPFV